MWTVPDYNANPTPGIVDPWLPAEQQDPTSATYAGGRGPNDTRCRIDPATAIYTDLDTGEERTWWQQREYVRQRQMSYAHQLSRQRYVGSDMQNLWGRKPHFFDDWYGGYIPEYRLPNPRSDLRRMNEAYGGPGPYPPGPMPNSY